MKRNVITIIGWLALLVSGAVTGLCSQDNQPPVNAYDVNVSPDLSVAIMGTVWHDINLDGHMGPTELGLMDMVVQLDTGQETRTDPNGQYLFSNLLPGSYQVSVAAPTWYQTRPCTADTTGFDHAGVYLIQGQDDSHTVESRSVIYDPNGCVYYSGLFRGTVDFDPSEQTALRSSPNKTAVYVTKFDTEMAHLWTVVFPTGWASTCKQIALNAKNQILVAYDGCLVKLDDQGKVLWTKEFNNNGRILFIKDMTVATDDTLYLTGTFDGKNDFHPGPATDFHTGQGFVNQFVTRLNADDSYAWTRILGERNANIEPTAIVSDTSRHVTVCGYYRGTINFDPTGAQAAYTSRGDYDCYLWQLSPEGHFRWAKSIGGAYWDKAFDICIDRMDHIYLTGAYSNWVDFNPDKGEDRFFTPYANIGECFLTKFSVEGDYEWTITLAGQAGRSAGMAVQSDPWNHVWLLGESLAEEPALRSDLFLAHINSSGHILTHDTFPSVMDTVINDVGGLPAFQPWRWNLSMSPAGDWTIVGQFSGKANLHLPDSTHAVRSSQGLHDGFLLTLKKPACVYTLDLVQGEIATDIDFGLIQTQPTTIGPDPNHWLP